MIGLFVLAYYFLLILEPVKPKTSITSPSVHPVYLKSGSELDLLCEQSEGFRVVWSKSDPTDLNKEYKIIDSSVETGFVTLTFANVEGVYHLRLMKKDVQTWDSGSYKCSVPSGTDLPFAVDVYVLEVISGSGLITNAGNSTTVSCSLINGDVRAGVRWFKSGNEISSSLTLVSSSTPVLSSPTTTHVKYVLNVTYTDTTSDTTLLVRNVGESDVGEYVCQFELNKQNIFNHSVYLYSYPQIKPLGRSKNLAEGKTLEISCKVWGWPLPDVTWSRKDDSSFFATNDMRISFPDNYSLKIDPVVVTDRAEYVCRAINIINETVEGTAESSFLLRVRGKYAPLFPLVGIILEFLILFIIIFWYERNKKNKLLKEKVENLNQQSNNPAQGHRRVSRTQSGGGTVDENTRWRKRQQQQQHQL